VSHANLAEITGPADGRHAEEIARFFEAVLPNVYFAMFNVQQAINQEKQPRNIGIRLKAPPDLELLMAVGRERPDDFQPFTIATIIKGIAEGRDRLGVAWRESNQRLADRINEERCNPETVRKAKSFADYPAHVPTWAVMQELLRPAFLDNTFRIGGNDAGDFHHAILSIVYCDFVLLDGKWEDLHERMKRRFAELGLTIPTASVFPAAGAALSVFFRRSMLQQPRRASATESRTCAVDLRAQQLVELVQ
jgi:hypothetical protein